MAKQRDLHDEELLRYSRHILLDEIGIEGQSRISNAKVLVVGVGGLGCPCVLYLASAGVGTIYIADSEEIDLTNLQRQVLYTTTGVGMLKVTCAKNHLNQLNPCSLIVPLASHLEGKKLEQAVSEVDVVLDCCDNFQTRHAVNRACVKFSKPLVSGAALGLDGQLALFELNNPHAGCYHCLFPEGDDVLETRCATMGVFAPLTGVIGTLQASEALKIIAKFGTPTYGTLQIYDSRNCEFKKIKIRKDPNCAVCAKPIVHSQCAAQR